MKKILFVIICLMSGSMLLRAFAQTPQKPTEEPKHQLATIGQPIAGIPFDQAEKIANKHTAEIRALPGVVSVSFSADGLVVETVKPEILPANVEGLPVIPIPPIDAEGVGVLERGLPPRASSPPPVDIPPVGAEPPHPVACPPGAILEPGAHRCKYTTPNQPPKVNLPPPPPGVIVLKPGKVRENRDSCPEKFEEINAYGWRFCVDPQNPQEIPPLYGAPIAGITYEDALAIHNRHSDRLMKIKGVVAVGLGADGIRVETRNPELIPNQIEGVPVIVSPPVRRGFTGHSFNNPVRPLHGAAAIYSYTINDGGTLTGVVVSDGHPWLITAAHVINSCNTPSPCALNGTPLNQCPHYNTVNQRVMVQPINSSLSVVGYAQRWSALPNGGVSNDVAAIYLDSDTIEGNNFLTTNRKVENETSSIDFSGIALAPPAPGMPARMRSSIGPPHVINLTVTAAATTFLVEGGCGPSHTGTLQNQTYYTTSQSAFQFGDSGSPIFNTSGATNGDLIGMLNWCELVFDPVIGEDICSGNGGGTNAPTILSTLKFDRWYGKNTVKDQSVGVFRPSH